MSVTSDWGDPDIAVVGMAGRFPGANDIGAFWQNRCEHARYDPPMQIDLSNTSGFVATNISYKLNLKGPSCTLHAAGLFMGAQAEQQSQSNAAPWLNVGWDV